ncbi:cytochrome P450 [Sphingosinicellaceae bacterium]|nr:cytochrome P450 [Sphingosinicellaceae bacterium]
MPFPGFDRLSDDNILVNPAATADDSVHEIYTRLRNEDPVHWCEPTGYRPFWAITRHADITTVSKANSRFINSKRTYLAPADVEKWTLDTVGDTHLLRTLVDLDDPQHMKLRRLTHDWFLPANLRKLEPMITAVARDHVDRMAALGGACDFVNEVALFYPLRVIMRILGVPESDEAVMLRMTQEMFGAQDPDVVARSKLLTQGAGGIVNTQVDLFQLVQEYFAYFGAITADRRANPRDDLSTIIANGMIDGAPIGELEAMSYYIIIATAGHDTTSSTAAGGFEQLIRNPAETAKLQADPSLLGCAVEEMIRWVTPVKHFMRTATEDTEFGGKTIRAGDGLCLFYASGNRDERAFADPFQFKADRSPNQQVAFGNGVHMCLGLHLARLELRLLFAELLPRLISVTLAGEPLNSIANFVSGRKTLPIRYEMR